MIHYWLAAATVAFAGFLGGVAFEMNKARFITLVKPLAAFKALECFNDITSFEPWHVVADGQVLHVGNWKYLAVTREQRNSNDRYDGYKVYGFEVDIALADSTWTRTECPRGWK